jgi:hypothetical protein
MATMRAAQMSTQDENSVLVQAMGGGGGLGGGSGLTKPAARAFGTSLGSGGKASTGLQKPARKALGNITNQTSRRALGDITNNVKPAPQAPNVKVCPSTFKTKGWLLMALVVCFGYGA